MAVTDEHAKKSSQRPTRETATGGVSRVLLECGWASPLSSYPPLRQAQGRLFAKNAKDGTPIVLVMRARSKAPSHPPDHSRGSTATPGPTIA